jgi:hypothetical protein
VGPSARRLQSGRPLVAVFDQLAVGETPPADVSVTTAPAPALLDGRRAPALVVGGIGWHVVADTASLRSFLAAGRRPVGAEVLFGP